MTKHYTIEEADEKIRASFEVLSVSLSEDEEVSWRMYYVADNAIYALRLDETTPAFVIDRDMEIGKVDERYGWSKLREGACVIRSTGWCKPYDRLDAFTVERFEKKFSPLREKAALL